jgi:hypothetical protein
MPRVIRQDAEAVGSDSFLDVVTNIVGILIILVMVVGIRVKNTPKTAAVADSEAAKVRVVQLQDEADALESDMLKLEDQMRAVAFSTQARFQERGTLAYLASGGQSELDRAKQSLDAEARAAFEARRAVAAVEDEVRRLEAAKSQAALPKKKKPIQIKSYPTPLSHTVMGAEIHFRLCHGRLAWVPLQELADEVSSDVRAREQQVRADGAISGTVGAIAGFRASYDFEVLQLLSGPHQSFHMELMPISETIGEPVDDALRDPSEFGVRLTQSAPRGTTVTLWTYGDSFADYARIKDTLYHLGYSVAARPLSDGINIGASDDGTRSSAQ